MSGESTHHNRFENVHTFHQRNHTTDLRIPEGYHYVEASTIERVKEALEQGYAVFGEGCEGKVFAWPADEGYEADQFALGPANQHHFDDIEEVADFVADLSE